MGPLTRLSVRGEGFFADSVSTQNDVNECKGELGVTGRGDGEASRLGALDAIREGLWQVRWTA
jgi:hypothetical protein